MMPARPPWRQRATSWTTTDPCSARPPTTAGLGSTSPRVPGAFSVQNLRLTARALGLGTVLTRLHRRRKARIHEILGIPDHVESAAIIPVGWPDREYGPNRRPPLERFVMRDRWSR